MVAAMAEADIAPRMCAAAERRGVGHQGGEDCRQQQPFDSAQGEEPLVIRCGRQNRLGHQQEQKPPISMYLDENRSRK